MNYQGHTSFAHSHVVNTNVSPTDSAALFGSATELQQAISHLALSGGDEDGWDAIEHAIAEYNVREDAVPVLVLLQNGEGRVTDHNKTLTRNGILATLESKNVIFNAIVVGDGPALFDLASYAVTSGDFTNRRVIGVEADVAENGSIVEMDGVNVMDNLADDDPGED